MRSTSGSRRRPTPRASARRSMPDRVDDVLDTAGMWDVAAHLPEQVFDAAVAARGLDGLPNRERIEHIVVLGMGGSGIASDVLLAATGPFPPVPVIVPKGYDAPAFGRGNNLVFALPYS